MAKHVCAACLLHHDQRELEEFEFVSITDEACSDGVCTDDTCECPTCVPTTY